MKRIVTKVVLLLMVSLIPPTSTRLGQPLPRHKFKAAIVPDQGEQWEWYCSDPREHPEEVITVYHEGTESEKVVESDPDKCDSEIALFFRSP